MADITGTDLVPNPLLAGGNGVVADAPTNNDTATPGDSGSASTVIIRPIVHLDYQMAEDIRHGTKPGR